jgi:hypothetical protein
MKSFISQVALVSAATVTNPCPNEFWEPVLDDNGLQVENNGSIVCAPIPEAYKITCSPTGIELDIKYELMYDQVLDEQRDDIRESLKSDPAQLGNCFNQADQDETSLDYRFQLRYDAKNQNGDYCYSDVQGGQSNESVDETFINFIYKISPNMVAVTNEDGLILSSVLNFSVYCALPESFGVSNDHDVLIPDGLHDGFDGLVAGADLSAAFVLNKYVADQIDNDSPVELGVPAHFKVEPIDQIPDFLDYFITGCDMEGITDLGNAKSHVINENVDCFYSYVQASHTTPNDLTFNMFAFGNSESSLQSNRLNCQVRLCFNGDSEGSCYSEYIKTKAGCGELYESPQEPVKYADHNTGDVTDAILVDDSVLVEDAGEGVEVVADEIVEEVVEEIVESEDESVAEVTEEITEDESVESEVAEVLTQADEIIDQSEAVLENLPASE